MTANTDIDSPLVLAIDLGGTNTPFGIVNESGEIVARGSIPTTGHASVEAWADELHRAVTETTLAAHLTHRLCAIGVGAPCANCNTGCIEAATDLPWSSPIPLEALLKERFDLPVAITNDANAAAAGEMIYGAARGIRNFIMLTLGTGVGGGVVCDGHLLSGSRGFAGELGHIVVRPHSDRRCGCGRTGCLQTFCSAKGVVTTALDMLDSDPRDSELRRVPRQEITARLVSEAAQREDALARDVYRFTGEILGEACAGFAAFTDPEAIVLFGGVARAGSLITTPMRAAFEKHALHLYRDRVGILTSQLDGADTAILGASAIAWQLRDK